MTEPLFAVPVVFTAPERLMLPLLPVNVVTSRPVVAVDPVVIAPNVKFPSPSNQTPPGAFVTTTLVRPAGTGAGSSMNLSHPSSPTK